MKTLALSCEESRKCKGKLPETSPPVGEGGGSPLPCLRYNNSTENPPEFRQKDRYGRFWAGDNHGWMASPDQQKKAFANHLKKCSDPEQFDPHLTAVLTPAERKQGYVLTQNVKALIQQYGIEKIGFLTLTFPDHIHQFREAQRRFNSFKSHILKPLFNHFIVVMEPSEKRRLHYHLLVLCQQDIRTGFNFDAVSGRDYRSANPYLKALWKQLRQTAPRYSFGRTELMPLKSTVEAAAKYVGKYISKASHFRGPELKGARMVRYSKGQWRAANTRFSWAVGTEWRAYLASVGQNLGVTSYDQFSAQYGRFWGYTLKQWFDVAPESPELAARYLANGRFLT